MKDKLFLSIILILVLVYLSPIDLYAQRSALRYAVIISNNTRNNARWQKVAEALKTKHQAKVFFYNVSIDEIRQDISQYSPFYICFVARPGEATRNFVESCHRFARQLDNDPYGDAIWGIITGYTAEDALRIAQYDRPLRVGKGLSATDNIGLRFFESGKTFSECIPGRQNIKTPDGQATRRDDLPHDTTKLIVNELNTNTYDIFCTSGHATERDWQLGYSYRNGQFIHRDGTLYGVDINGRGYPINTQNPKIYYPPGNCLIGHISSRDCMATSWMHSGGAYMMCGYTKGTPYGFMGWGLRDYFFHPGDYFTFAESFFMINQALIYGLQYGVGDRKVLIYDKDIVALYGDPAWDARLWSSQGAYYTQNLTYEEIKPGKFRFTCKVIFKKDKEFDGQKPLGAILPFKIKKHSIIKLTNAPKAIITENFLLVPINGKKNKGEEILLIFDANTK